jgi:hypothetical protein
VVSQTQDSAVVPDLPTNPLVTARDALANANDGSPAADNTAIAEMTAGRRNEDDANIDGRTSRTTRMVLFNRL